MSRDTTIGWFYLELGFLEEHDVGLCCITKEKDVESCTISCEADWLLKVFNYMLHSIMIPCIDQSYMKIVRELGRLKHIMNRDMMHNGAMKLQYISTDVWNFQLLQQLEIILPTN